MKLKLCPSAGLIRLPAAGGVRAGRTTCWSAVNTPPNGAGEAISASRAGPGPSTRRAEAVWMGCSWRWRHPSGEPVANGRRLAFAFVGYHLTVLYDLSRCGVPLRTGVGVVEGSQLLTADL
jgi:hypothetical protein